jgi:Phage Mu protein F like protein
VPPPRSRVDAELARTSAEVARLAASPLAALTPALADAQRDLARGLRAWAARADHAARFDPRAHRAALAEIYSGLASVERVRPVLSQALERAHDAAGSLALAHLGAEATRLPQLLGVGPTQLTINVERALAAGERAASTRYRDLATRLVGDIAADIRREFALGIVRRETVGGLLERLARLGGPRPAGANEDPWETIATALFRRYRAWVCRIVRTEVQRAYNDLIDEMLREASGSQPDVLRRWDASMDVDVCDRCEALHGALAELDGTFPGGVTGAPLHPNCRCRIGVWRRAWDEPESPSAKAPREGEEIIPVPFDAPLRAVLSPTPPRTFTARSRLPSTFADHEEANRWATARWPHIVWDFESVHPKLAQEALAELRRLAKDFPAVMARLRYVGAYRNIPDSIRLERFTPGAFAHASGGSNPRAPGDKIALNRYWWGDPVAFRKKKELGYQMRFSVTRNAGGTIAHEFGHLVDAWIRASRLSPFRAQEFGGLELILGEFQRYNRPRRALSIVGMMDDQEAFAEAFARIRTAPRRTWDGYTQAIAGLLELARASVPESSLPSLTSMTPAQVRAATSHANRVLRFMEVDAREQ